MRTLLLVGTLAGLAVAGDRTADPLVGKWEVLSVIRGDMPDNDMRGAIREHLFGGKYTVTPPAGSKTPPVGGTYTVDDTKKPPQVDMMPDNGKYKGQTLKGVYKVDGDSLVIAFAEPGQPRPKDTEPKPDRVVATHKRAK